MDDAVGDFGLRWDPNAALNTITGALQSVKSISSDHFDKLRLVCFSSCWFGSTGSLNRSVQTGRRYRTGQRAALRADVSVRAERV